MKNFADHSKLLNVVERMGDWKNLHSDLVVVIQWKQKNNMQMNGNKVVETHLSI